MAEVETKIRTVPHNIRVVGGRRRQTNKCPDVLPGVDVLTSTNISEEDAKKYNKVLEKFNSFFKVRKNIR